MTVGLDGRAVIEIWKICPARFAEFLESATTAIGGGRIWGAVINRSCAGKCFLVYTQKLMFIATLRNLLVYPFLNEKTEA